MGLPKAGMGIPTKTDMGLPKNRYQLPQTDMGLPKAGMRLPVEQRRVWESLIQKWEYLNQV